MNRTKTNKIVDSLMIISLIIMSIAYLYLIWDVSNGVFDREGLFGKVLINIIE